LVTGQVLFESSLMMHKIILMVIKSSYKNSSQSKVLAQEVTLFCQWCGIFSASY